MPGPKNGYRADELRTDFQNEQFFQNVILPGIALMPSIKSFAKLSTRQDFISHKFPDNNIFPRGYCIQNPLTDYVMHGIVTSRMRDEKPVFFSPPKYAIEIARKILQNICGDKKPVILTVRELEREGRIENSNHIPRGMLEFWLDPESSYFKQGKLDLNKEMVLFCAGGMRSALAAKSLKDMGFNNVSHIDGGFGALKQSKFKIT